MGKEEKSEQGAHGLDSFPLSHTSPPAWTYGYWWYKRQIGSGMKHEAKLLILGPFSFLLRLLLSLALSLSFFSFYFIVFSPFYSFPSISLYFVHHWNLFAKGNCTALRYACRSNAAFVYPSTSTINEPDYDSRKRHTYNTASFLHHWLQKLYENSTCNQKYLYGLLPKNESSTSIYVFVGRNGIK